MPTLKVELPTQQSITDRNLSRWAEVTADPRLSQLEERIETNRFGHIVMSPPASAQHGSLQFRIGAFLNKELNEGRVITECPISTADGVKAADVAWASSARLKELGANSCFPHAPEICVEVFSPGNSEAEIQEKTVLYFDAGALEVWHCSVTGRMAFFHAGFVQASRNSRLCPAFPAQIDL